MTENVLILAATLVVLAGVFLAGLGFVALLDAIPAVHRRIEAWMPESPWWEQ